MMRLLQTEWQKTRRRHVFLPYAASLLTALAWMLWAMRDMDDVVKYQGYYYLLISFPMMNAIFLPTILAAAESRICDIEIKGNTLKMLCTMQKRQSIYHIKLLLGSLYLLLFTLLETACIPLLCICMQVTQPLPVKELCYFFISTLIVGLVLIILQQSLSLISDNQLLPLFVGVGGTFAGIFSWFFPNLPIRYFLPWGYYCVGTTINLLYDEASREVTYYAVPFPWLPFLGFMLFGIFVYMAGKYLFMKKEI